jgi:hypothetical protein
MISVLTPRFDPLNPHCAVENMKLLADDPASHESDIYAFIHDDFHWLESPFGDIEAFMAEHPRCGMIGMGGALGLGTVELYKRPYDYRQLARINFYSNLVDAEAHGFRATKPMQVAVLDGFCQIIRRTAYEEVGGWKVVLDAGVTFHMYDAYMACLMAEHKWEVWMLPISCEHHGGMTSTSTPYLDWLESHGTTENEVHKSAHCICYKRFRNILPIYIGDRYEQRRNI